MGLGRVERIEELPEVLWINALAGVTHGEPNRVRVWSGSDDQKIAWTIINRAHRVGGVEDEIQNDLLNLDAIGIDERQAGVEIRSQGYPTDLKLARREGKHLARSLGQVNGLIHRPLAREHGAEALDHFGRPVSVPQRALGGSASPV